ncbi:MAG TPA: ABC transporter permease [Terriglobia bacterium]|nr:ABC transporter permease [Terriglobia bacterium]
MWQRFRSLLRRSKLEHDLDDELRFHLEMRTTENLATGMSPEEARQAASRSFGGVAQFKEECRDMKTLAVFENLLQDSRYGLRALGKNPGFTVVAVLTLALGVGANTAIFSIINGVFLRPLPYPEPDRLVFALSGWQHYGWDDAARVRDLLFWTEHSRSFESLGLYQANSGFNLVAGGQPRYVQGTLVSDGLFRSLGVTPAVGRDFLPEESKWRGPHAAILSYNLWQNRFGSDPAVVGREIQLNGEAYTVVGVMRRGFDFVSAADVYLPLQLSMTEGDPNPNFQMVGRLRPGVTREQAQQEAAAVLAAFRQEYPQLAPAEWLGLRWITYRQELTGDVRTPLLVLFGAVGLLLLIAIANIANLFLGRTAARQAEIALRSALGATRVRIRQQLLTEGMLVALIGGALGLLTAPATLKWLLALAPKTLGIDFSGPLVPLLGQVGLDGRVLAFTFLASLLAGAAAGLAPSLQFSRLSLNEWLKQGSRAVSSARSHHRLRGLLVVLEMALSLTLLAGAGLLLVSFVQLRSVNPGFDPRHLWALQLSLAGEKYKTTAAVWSFDQKLLARLRSLPGVTSVASTSNLPVERGLNDSANVPGCGQINIQGRGVSPEYFQTMGIPLLQGRSFLEQDGQTKVVVINQALARRCWPNRSPLGEALGHATIVGVAGNTRERGLDNPAPPTIFEPQWQMQDGLTAMMHSWFLSAWVIRSTTPLTSETVERAVGDVDATQPVANFRSMNDVIADSNALAKNRFLSLLLAGFAGSAILLAAIGMYGVVSYAVTQRTHEFGVRLALGAAKGDVLRLVVGEGVRLALLGAGIGLAASFVVTRFLQSLLYGVRVTDPLTFAGVSLVLMAVALIACYVPARRATRVDPMVALRHE